MRRPGREFGSENPKVIYVALRWNDSLPRIEQETNMINKVARKLHVEPGDLRIYNLVRPSKDRGMSLLIDEFGDVEQTVKRIKSRINGKHTVKRIVVGGRSGPMPIVALLLKMVLPAVRIEVRNHHKARPVNGPPLELAKVIRR
jgi:hypothetical protein